MKKILVTGYVLIFLLLPAVAVTHLNEFLEQIEAKEIRLLESESNYDSIVEFLFEQPLDHRNPEGPVFKQRIYISHFDPGRPVVLVTEGYDANYYYTSELAAALRCNQVMVEHRYFGRSRPDSIQWEYLDTWQAASDYHRIIEAFKTLYPGQWIATGISKGGQTVMYHSYYYPDDVDVRVPYVAPLNFGVEDKRIYAFLDQVGSTRDRRKVKQFQKTALKYQERYLPAFREFSEKKGYTYEIAGGSEKAFEYCVLEYSFAFWQWGYVPAGKIPGRSARPMEFVEHMNRVAGFDYFSDEAILEQRPFFYQALTEMGYYGYDLKEFEKYIRHVTNPVFTFTLPAEIEVTFDSTLSADVERYLSREAERFIYIYGENDTWSATAVAGTGDTESKIFYKEGGSHRTRINNMPAEQKKEVYDTLNQYLRSSAR
ncbi:MAG: S28 family serine protease [Bacteroidales bacterium]